MYFYHLTKAKTDLPNLIFDYKSTVQWSQFDMLFAEQYHAIRWNQLRKISNRFNEGTRAVNLKTFRGRK